MRTFFSLLWKAAQKWNDDKASQLGAALAYYTIFSLTPLLLILISAAGFIVGEEAAKGEIVRQITDVVGKQSAEFVESLIANASKPVSGIIAASLGFITLIIGATGVFAQLQEALDTVWGVKPEAGRSWLRLLKDRFISFTMVLGIGFLLLVSLMISAIIAFITKYMANFFGEFEFLLQFANLLIFLIVTTLLFAMMYKILPDVRLEWRDVWVGALLTATLFTFGKLLIALYLGKTALVSTFGAAASLVMIVSWVYYSAQIFLLGAEFTQVYATHRGSWRYKAVR